MAQSLLDPALATQPPLAPLRGALAVEAARTHAAAYCGRLLRELGARVVKVEPPEGDPSRAYGPFPASGPDPERSGLFIYGNGGKESVVLDLETDTGQRDLAALTARADVLIDDAPSGGLDALAAANPALVRVSITPFGLTGPYAGWKAEHLTISHAGGEGYTMPGAIGHPREVFGQRPPVQIGGLIADSTAGLVGAMAALAALAVRDATGLGQRVDVSRWEAELLANRQSLDFGVNRGRPSARYGPSTPNQVLFPCKDGVIFLTFHRQEQFERLTTLMERPELAADPRFATVEARLANLPAVFDEIAGWLADREGEAVFDLMESRGMIAAYFPTPPQVAASEQARAIGLFGEVELSSGARLRLPRPLYFSTLQATDKRDGAQAREMPRVPRLGEHTAAVLAEIGRPSSAPSKSLLTPRRGPTLPLEGVRILEFTWILAGPFATHLLSCLGAEVIKVESSRRLDTARFENFVPVPGTDPDRSHDFAYVNLNKQSVVLDLKRPEALDVVYDLVKTCDAVVDNMRPGVMETLALGPDVLRQHNPTLVTLSASGFGPVGPRKDYPAIAAVFAGSSGLGSITGYADGPPTVTQTPVDVRASASIAFALQAALLERARTGRGRHVDVASFASIVCLIGHVFAEAQLTGRDPQRAANAHPWMAPHGVYRCAGDDQWVSVAAADEAAWAALCGVIGRAGLAADPRFADAEARKRNEAALDAIIEAWTSALPPMEAARRLQAAGVAAFPSMSNLDIHGDPHLHERGYFGRAEHPGLGPLITMRPPWRFESFAGHVRRPAPLLGEHTRSVLSELAGYTPQTLDALEDAGVFV